jgi:hypothetical protein
MGEDDNLHDADALGGCDDERRDTEDGIANVGVEIAVIAVSGGNDPLRCSRSVG